MIKDIYNAHSQKTRTIWDGTEWKDKSVKEEANAFIQAYKEKYPNRKGWQIPKYADTYGELFFIRYASMLTTAKRVYIDKVIDDIEGTDAQSFDLLGDNGNIEVKTINNYLVRGDTNNEPSGTIPFEIFHRWLPDQPEKMYAGWLLSDYDMATYNDIKRTHGRSEHAETSGVLAFMLMRSDNEPFACVAFEDIRALLIRLYELCPDAKGWGIPDPDTLISATDQAYWRQFSKWDQDKGKMIQNVWHVPFKSLSDLATVTMIGNVDPAEEVRNAKYRPCTSQTAEARLQALQDRANQQERREHFDPEAFTQEQNEAIKRIEAIGGKVKKRMLVDLRIFDQLKHE